MPLPTGEYDGHGSAPAYGRDVHLGREATAGAPERLVLRTAYGPGSMSMRTDDSTVNEVRRPVELAFRFSFSLEFL